MRSSIIVPATDYKKLRTLINSARLDRRVPVENLDALEQELSRAAVVEPDDVPQDVVTMNATVWFRDLDSDEVEKYTLVYPSEADVMSDRISVFAPIGAALLGFRSGDIVQWQVPSGTRRFEIVEVVQVNSPPQVDEPVVTS